ncbi:pyruvate carboxylase [Curvivirga aplysinae]|uniref:pyruvate carboxylase n=1 Tax=Curvivirga aplysinae TaxID=2529852 RepID=UPI0012BC97FA|nr:pyruvate carboxylase [Curvivirga aplysinae]MTI10297.1 pyruvate carboxylase [Curvivirga aplysinae]
MTKTITKLLVANRGEIAIRIFRAANELGIKTVAIYSYEDRFSLHRFKADESYMIGEGKGPVQAYLDQDDILQLAKTKGVDAIHPGYGFLSENPEFADKCRAAGVTFVGPLGDTMRLLGSKVAARELAEKADVPVMPATGPLPRDIAEVEKLADEVGYPLMLKASWGGGGRGMRVIESADSLADQVETARREAEAAFGNDEVYLEKLVRNARHVEVQIVGDSHGNIVHLFERDCTVQRRNQKVVERAPGLYMTDESRASLCQAALKLAHAADYQNAGTVEFLMDAETDKFYFIEVNPRIQVEHTVTEVVTGIDIVKAQIRIAEGATIGDSHCGIPQQENIHLRGHAMQCRVTTEDPENNFIPDYGRIKVYRGANGFGIRLDGSTAYSGAVITPFFDSMLEKVTAWGATPEEAQSRMDRALREYRIRGVATNLAFLENLINHPKFKTAEYTTRFIDDTPELFHFPKRRDRATRLLRFVGDVIVNGNPEVEGRLKPKRLTMPEVPKVDMLAAAPAGYKQKLEELGAEGFSKWMLSEPKALVTDTTMRDAHQSLLATRMREFDMLQIAPVYARMLPEIFSMECWGGATFDVAYRFLKEDPWNRLSRLRQAMPNMLTQMLLRASNAVGYTNYPDNVVQHFVKEASAAGMDIFRVFDSLNWVENMRVAMDAVIESGSLCEGTICYSGDMLAEGDNKYTLAYYVDMAKQLEKAGAHIIGIKDMAGVAKPAAISKLVTELKQEVGIPLHFHTHDTSGIAAASVIAAVNAGVDAFDSAMDSFSGLTSQPNLGSIVSALKDSDRDPGLDEEAIRTISRYWESVRENYEGFESDIRSGASEVYLHAMPGGQYTNLREQARATGIEHRWPEVAKAYAEVNDMFGDIVKVTPSSKVVGDMAIYMVSSDLTRQDVEDPNKPIAFPESVVALFRGDLGQPVGGFPEALQKKILKGEKANTDRPGAHLPPVDLDAALSSMKEKFGDHVGEQDVSAHQLYPKVYEDYSKHRALYGDVSVLPTATFFYGMEAGQEITVEIEAGKTLIVRYLNTGEADEDGERTVFFELNGQPRTVKIADKSLASSANVHLKAEDGNPAHVPAPMPGMISSIAVQQGQEVYAGDVLLSIEAMKMETAIHAEADGVVEKINVHVGSQVQSKDLLVNLKIG